MTSSEPPPPGDANAANAPAPGEQPLLQGHLHPAVLLLRLLDGLRSAALPLVVGVVAQNKLFLTFAAVAFLGQLGYGLVRWLTFHYTLTPSELRTREGILNRQERRIPIDRVQDLGFEATILRRVLGITVVSVETASGKGAEAVLDSLGRAEAEQLREVLLAARRQALQPTTDGDTANVSAPGAPLPHEPEPEWTVYLAAAGDLLLRGLTDLRVGALVVSAFAALQVADQIGVVVRLRGLANSFFEWLHGFPIAVVALLLAALVGSVLALSVLASAFGNLMLFHGFALTLRGDTLLARHGLLTRRQKTLPRQRVQRITIEQTWLRRLLGKAVVFADSAGSGRGPGEEQASGFDVVVPLASLPTVQALLPALVPSLQGLPYDYRRASSRLVWRMVLKGAVWAAIAASAAWVQIGAWALGAFALLPLAWVVGQLAWGNLGWQLDQGHLFLRFGILGRYQAVLPTAKVQAVAQRCGPLQLALGLCDLTVYVAGGSPTRLPDLPVEAARALQNELASRGGLAAEVEWAAKNALPRRDGGA